MAGRAREPEADMSSHDDVYRESVHDWLDEREPPERPEPDDLSDERYDADWETACRVATRRALRLERALVSIQGWTRHHPRMEALMQIEVIARQALGREGQ